MTSMEPFCFLLSRLTTLLPCSHQADGCVVVGRRWFVILIGCLLPRGEEYGHGARAGISSPPARVQAPPRTRTQRTLFAPHAHRFFSGILVHALSIKTRWAVTGQCLSSPSGGQTGSGRRQALSAARKTPCAWRDMRRRRRDIIQHSLSRCVCVCWLAVLRKPDSYSCWCVADEKALCGSDWLCQKRS